MGKNVKMLSEIRKNRPSYHPSNWLVKLKFLYPIASSGKGTFPCTPLF
jgi:hypothetical protein